MTASATPSDTQLRALLTDWIAETTGHLDPAERTELDQSRPGWDCTAAQLIAEGLLGYVLTEMVQPDLAYQRQGDPQAHTSAEDLIARLAAHLLDFIDYRDVLSSAQDSDETGRR